MKTVPVKVGCSVIVQCLLSVYEISSIFSCLLVITTAANWKQIAHKQQNDDDNNDDPQSMKC